MPGNRFLNEPFLFFHQLFRPIHRRERISPFFQPVEREEQRVVAVVLEAGGDGGNVQQIVGFDDDEARDQTLILPMAVEEVERHALL